MSLADAWTGAVRQIVADALNAREIPLTAIQATVTTVQAAAAVDGNPLATCTWQQATFTAAYLASYTPTAGHQVLVLLVGSDPVIIGRVVGTPPAT